MTPSGAGRSVRHPHQVPQWRVTWPARGSGKPGREPDEPRKTDRTQGATHDDGSGSHRRLPVRPEEGCLSRQREPLPTRVHGLPPLPPAYAAGLEPALASLGVSLATDDRGRIDDHVRLLLAWNDAINLTAIRDPAGIGVAHVADSLAAIPVLHAAGVSRFVDLGSGAGYPGLPLAIALPAEALLVDSIAKKAGFMRTAIDALGLADQVRALGVRGEELARDPEHRERWPAVTARAIGSLAEVIELAFPLLELGGLVVAWKGPAVDAELAPAERALAAMGGGRIEVRSSGFRGAEDHRLVVVTKRGRTPAAYPRDPALRRRRGW
ncbi:MAG TPA: 16S rRNA (guanine(527)-N(7))-methyltransferase RsmG [Candidatus Limnocylindrales bacterium]